MAIRKNLFISLQDKSEGEDGSQAFVPAIHFKTTEDGSVIVESVAEKVVISLTDLDDALNEIQEFYHSNPNKELDEDSEDDIQKEPSIIQTAKETIAVAKEITSSVNMKDDNFMPKKKKAQPKPKLMHNIEYKEIEEDPSLKVE